MWDYLTSDASLWLGYAVPIVAFVIWGAVVYKKVTK